MILSAWFADRVVGEGVLCTDDGGELVRIEAEVKIGGGGGGGIGGGRLKLLCTMGALL